MAQNKQIMTILCSAQNHEELSIQNKNLIFKSDSKTKIKHPINKIEYIIVVGEMTLTTPFINQITSLQIPIILCDHRFLPTANINPVQLYSNSELKLKQFEILQNPTQTLETAKSIISDKITNQLSLLLQKKNRTSKIHQSIPRSEDQT